MDPDITRRDSAFKQDHNLGVLILIALEDAAILHSDPVFEIGTDADLETRDPLSHISPALNNHPGYRGSLGDIDLQGCSSISMESN